MIDRFLASDNSASVHPAIMDALRDANEGHAVAYGDDPWTERARAVFHNIFGNQSDVFFVYNGTGANVVGMQTGLSSFHGVICSDISHINYDECGAAENYIGCKLLPVDTPDGRIALDQLPRFLESLGEVHHSQPGMVSITQATEFGTVYDPKRVREIADFCHSNKMYLHMDGARLSNAAVNLDMNLAQITGDLGVDLLSLGGTKNGIMFGEAIVVFNNELKGSLPYVRKQGMQLASKMRYIAVQFETLFGTDLWKQNATHANTLARELENQLRGVSGVEIVWPVEANGVFVRLPESAIKPLQEEMFFYVWDPQENIVRLMVSFDTSPDDVERFVAAVRRHV